MGSKPAMAVRPDGPEVHAPLFIAAGSFFSIRERFAKVLPEPFTTGPIRALPILLVFVATFYWVWRVRRRGPPPGAVNVPA